jgi:hypothetical protein
MTTVTAQRDGATAVTATRYPLAARKKGEGARRRGPRAAGGGGCAPSRRHGRHWPRFSPLRVVRARRVQLLLRLRLCGPRRRVRGFGKHSSAAAAVRALQIIVPAFPPCFRFAFDPVIALL